jgi:glycosyltransferase involved in cell wall biosynthesis
MFKAKSDKILEKHSSLRIFIGYSEIAGFCSSLSYSFNELGHKSHFCNLLPNKYYPVGKLTIIEFLLRYYLSSSASKNKVSNFFRRNIKKTLLKLLYSEMKFNYDVFILIGTYSPFAENERALLKGIGKTIISVFLGSDSRPLYLNALYYDQYSTDYEGFAKAIKRQYEKIRKIEDGSDMVVCHALSAHFLSRPFIRFMALGFPKVIEKDILGGSKEPSMDSASDKKPMNKTLKILHAPTAPKYKGSEKISRMVEELKEEGIAIELQTITCKPSSEVIHALKNCDLVIDELYSDTPLAGFAHEAGQFAKLPVVGSYANKNDFFGDTIPPSLLIHPDKLKDAIKELFYDRIRMREKGEALRKFIEDEWNYANVAMRYAKLLINEQKNEWYSSPDDIRYVHGWGIDENELKSKLKELIIHTDSSILCLHEKPELEKTILSFIGFSEDDTMHVEKDKNA